MYNVKNRYKHDLYINIYLFLSLVFLFIGKSIIPSLFIFYRRPRKKTTPRKNDVYQSSTRRTRKTLRSDQISRHLYARRMCFKDKFARIQSTGRIKFFSLFCANLGYPNKPILNRYVVCARR